MFQKSFDGTLQKISHACINNFLIYPFTVLKMYIQCTDRIFNDVGSFVAEVSSSGTSLKVQNYLLIVFN
jgi:hypothetical protein